ncbi:MAG: hypothetical protein ABSD31_16055, partial [Candidatus Binataceae bacterium]
MKILPSFFTGSGGKSAMAPGMTFVSGDPDRAEAVLQVRRGIATLFALQIVYVVADAGTRSGHTTEL